MERMTSRPATLALALLCGLACDSSTKPAEPAKTDAKTEAKAEPKAEPKTDAKAEAKAETKAEPTPETKAEPTPQPTAPAGAPSLAAGIDAPDQPRVLELARTKGLAKPTLAAKLAEAGPRRFVAAIRDRKGATPAEYSLHLVLLRAHEPAPGAAVAWVADGVIELHRWSSPWLEDAEAGSIPTTLIVDDHERDGEIEVLVRFRHELMCPGGGPNTITELRIVELEPTLAITLESELHHAMVSTEMKGTVHHEDLDADGHPDLRIHFSTKSDHDPEPQVTESRWRWVPTDDTWAPLTDTATPPPRSRTGCDW